MKHRIELNREYPTRGGGKAVVYRDDGVGLFFYLGARTSLENDGKWRLQAWDENGVAQNSCPFGDRLDLILPRTVMVPITVPEWAQSVRVYGDETITFSAQPATEEWHLSVEDWIASLEGEDE